MTEEEHIEKIMLEHVIPLLGEEAIRKLRDACNVCLPEKSDPPKPREWRLWDMVRVKPGTVVLRDSHRASFPWQDISGITRWTDDEVNRNCQSYLGNLRKILEQGDVVVGLTEKEAGDIVSFWCSSIFGTSADKCRAALAERKK